MSDKKTVVQTHHLRYANDPLGEWKVKLWKGEHWLISLASRRKRVSKGFITCLKEYIRAREEDAVELEPR